MADKVLYFPYIRVPDSEWFTQVLLYWDEVGSIVPYEYVYSPEKLGSHMKDLVQVGLVKQIFPNELKECSHNGSGKKFSQFFTAVCRKA